MRTLSIITLAVWSVASVTAFPALKNPGSPQYAEFVKRAAEIKAGKGPLSELLKRSDNDSLGTPDNGFGHRTLTALINPDNFKYNAKEQFVDLTSDEHKYIPPGPDDIRGPCPGLNVVSILVISLTASFNIF